jgi:hypothetical protein
MLRSNQATKRNNGSASVLSGCCCFISIFLADKISFWPEADKLSVKEKIGETIEFFNNNAKNYNIDLTIKEVYYGYEKDIIYPGIIPIDMFANPLWTESVFSLIGFRSGNSLVNYSRKNLKSCQVVILFHVNKAANSYNLTYSSGIHQLYYSERDVMFNKYENGITTYSASYAHEILHSFGAGELYFPFDTTEERVGLAKQYFPDDVMHRVDSNLHNLTIGEYTAYRIGWLNTLDEKCKIFEDED